MRQYLKCYQVIMRTLGPVFIGSGKEIGKKEYVFLNQNEVGILDIQRLYGEMCRRGKQGVFEAYLLSWDKTPLTGWLRKQNIAIKEITPFIKYTLHCGDVVLEKGPNRLQVMECVKDAYGSPYIPGSSLKGMFRTVLLGADILDSPQKYQAVKRNLPRNAEIRVSRSIYLKNLKKDADVLEGTAYRTLQREDKNPKSAVNDILQGLVVSDSEPLSVDSLVLCQKVDVHTKGIRRNIPILRECVKPNTEIRFTITIDTEVCPITAAAIMRAVKAFIENYYQNFASAFTGAEKPKENFVLLGGGCGFVSKTVLYPLLGKRAGLETVPKIFEGTLGKMAKIHKHDRDKEYGASPHILKCTEYQGKNYQMGLCKIEKLELIG